VIDFYAMFRANRFVRALLAALFTLAPLLTARAQDPTPVPIVPIARITSPIKDQEARGTVIIQGAAVSPVFRRFEIAYAREPELETWTIIGGSVQPVPGGVLQSWNTRPLPDGVYTLRLQIFTTESTLQETRVSGLRLTNQASAANAAGSTAQQPATVGGPASAEGANEVDTARNTFEQLTRTANRLPAAFSRGVRIGLYVIGALVVYGVIKQLGLWLYKRYVRRRIDYGR
jgi:hypothetical protein